MKLFLLLFVFSIVAASEIVIDVIPNGISVFKGQNILLTCLASSKSNTTEFKWILPDIDPYLKEDRDKRIKEEKSSHFEGLQILKLKIEAVKYEDHGEYQCVGKDLETGDSKIVTSYLAVDEINGFAPAIWILVGFLLMTAASIAVIMYLEKHGISMRKREDEKIHEVQF